MRGVFLQKVDLSSTQDALCTISVFFILHFTYFFGGECVHTQRTPLSTDVQFACKQTGGVVDWEFFRIGDDYYLAAAAAAGHVISSAGQVSQSAGESAAVSTVYRLDKARKQFDVYQHLVTSHRSVRGPAGYQVVVRAALRRNWA